MYTKIKSEEGKTGQWKESFQEQALKFRCVWHRLQQACHYWNMIEVHQGRKEGCQGIIFELHSDFLPVFMHIHAFSKVTFPGLLWPFSYGPASDVAMVGVKRIARPYGSSSVFHCICVTVFCCLQRLQSLQLEISHFTQGTWHTTQGICFVL